MDKAHVCNRQRRSCRWLVLQSQLPLPQRTCVGRVWHVHGCFQHPQPLCGPLSMCLHGTHKMDTRADLPCILIVFGTCPTLTLPLGQPVCCCCCVLATVPVLLCGPSLPHDREYCCDVNGAGNDCAARVPSVQGLCESACRGTEAKRAQVRCGRRRSRCQQSLCCWCYMCHLMRHADCARDGCT